MKARKSSSAFTKRPNSLRGSIFEQIIVKEGYLQKLSSGLLSKWQSRYFELSGHYLKYYKKRDIGSDDSFFKKELRGVIDLHEVQSITSEGNANQVWLTMCLDQTDEQARMPPPNSRLRVLRWPNCG
jgi:hypothetical protein